MKSLISFLLLFSVPALSASVFDSIKVENSCNLPFSTASRVAIMDGSKNLVSSSVTSTTLGFLDATSSIQTQLNGKQALLGFTAENVANKATNLTSPDNTKYPTTLAVSNAIAAIATPTPAPTPPVTSVFGRTGAVAAQSGDYSSFYPSSTLTSARVYLGNVSNVATATAFTGDVALTNAGLTTVNALKSKAIPTLAPGFLQYNGSSLSWSNLAYTAGLGLTLTGSTFALDNAYVTQNYIKADVQDAFNAYSYNYDDGAGNVGLADFGATFDFNALDHNSGNQSGINILPSGFSAVTESTGLSATLSLTSSQLQFKTSPIGGTTAFIKADNLTTTDKTFQFPNLSGTLAVQNFFTATAPITYSNTTGVIAIPPATTSVAGYLTATDWNTFNNKVATTRTISTTAPITGGGDLSANRTIAIPASTNSVDGYLSATDHTSFAAKESALTFSSPMSRSVNTISIPAATSGVNGYLTSTDWSTFNGKQAAGNYITALTGDATASGPGSSALTLSTVNASPGTFGSASNYNSVTVNGKGLVTSISSSPIQVSESQVTNLATDLAAKEPTITSGTSSQYWRGDKSFQALNPAVIASTLTGFTPGAGTVSSTDSVLSALQKHDGNISAITSSQWTTAAGPTLYYPNSVMIGSSVAPSSRLHLIDTSTTAPRGILVDQFSGANTFGARITMRKARGTVAIPAAVVSGDTLGSWAASGHDGTSFIDSSKIMSTSTGTISTGIVPSSMAFQTMNSSGALTTGLTIDSAQASTFASSVTAPTFIGALTGTASGNEVPLTFSTGLTRSTNTVTVNTSQNIATLSNLTSNGFVKTTGGTGALSVDTTAYAPNTLTGYAAGTGTVTSSDTVQSAVQKVDANNLANDMVLFGNGADGNLTISSGTTNMTRDMYWQNVTISGTARINTGGYKIFISGTLDIANAPAQSITNNGAGGGAGNANGTAGTGGGVNGANTCGTGTSGRAGSTGTTGAGAAGTAASSLTGNGGSSGTGGLGGSASSGATAGGAATGSAGVTGTMIYNRPLVELLRGVSLTNGGVGGSSGGSGAGDGTTVGGGSGGGGGGGGVVFLSARTVNRGASTTASAIQALGQVGGGGGAKSSGTGPGGGAGSGGGGGGYIFFQYKFLTGSTATGCFDVSGGNGGAGGNGFGTGQGGDGGGGGGSGVVEMINTLTGAYSVSTRASGSAGGTHSGVTGGTSGPGATSQVNL